jgi:hypothetical protein
MPLYVPLTKGTRDAALGNLMPHRTQRCCQVRIALRHPPPLPPDEMAFVIDDGGRHRPSAPRKMHIDDQRVLTVPVSDDRIQSLAVGGDEKNASKH